MNPQRILIRDDANERWLSLSNLITQRVCHCQADFSPLLEWAETKARSGLWVATFISYEAASFCDIALKHREDTQQFLPMAWVGVFETATTIANPALAAVKPVELPEMSPEWSRQEYLERFQQVKANLQAGNSYQTNLTFRLSSMFNGDCYALFCQLCANQSGRYAAYLEFDEFTILSASPELFFQRSGNKISARPMKGTTTRGASVEEDIQLANTLKQDAKNQAENLMIVDMIRNDLGKVSQTGSVQVSELFVVEPYPLIQQMVSSVTSTSELSLAEIVKGLFPCASITGAPKANTMKIIAELEESARWIYTGSIGLIRPDGDCQFNVVIRSAVWQKLTGELSFGVGSGVVWDSTGEGEYEECLLKANILQSRHKLALFETLRWDEDGGYHLIDRHKARLQRSAKALGIPFDDNVFDELMKVPISQGKARVRVELSNRGELSQTIAELPEHRPMMKLAFCPWPVESSWPLLQHKIENRALYEQAIKDTVDCDQPVLWNEAGNVTESAYFNIVIREGEKLFTPPLSAGLLPGIFREELLAQGEIEEQDISRDRFGSADEIWLINSLRGWIRGSLVSG